MGQQRNIRQIVQEGITTVDQLQDALWGAIQLEFTVIPAYLCAEWSAQADSNLAGLFHNVVEQEMVHLALACNMYVATGASLQGKIASPDFVPTYPASLPLGMLEGVQVPLETLTPATVGNFMLIEYPEGGPVVTPPASPVAPPLPPNDETIGGFYATISSGFANVYGADPATPLPNPGPHQLNVKVGGDQISPILTVGDAQAAITLITDEGEGSNKTPDESSDGSSLAHYYTFAQIFYGAQLVQVNNVWAYSGTAIGPWQAPTLTAEEPGAADQQQFITDFTSVLHQLEGIWTSGSSLGGAIGTMVSLANNDGIPLVTAGKLPQFTVRASTSAAA